MHRTGLPLVWLRMAVVVAGTGLTAPFAAHAAPAGASVLVASSASPAPVISTATGGPGRGVAGNVSQYPESLAAGPDGSIYLGDLGVVREFSGTSTWERAVAGIGIAGYGGDHGLASQAQLGDLGQVSVDRAGNVLIADASNNRIRVLARGTGTSYGQAMTAGDIYTVAGTGTPSYFGDAGPATAAAVAAAGGVAADGSGNLIIADSFNSRIRVVAAATGTFYGQAMTAGDIYTIAGNGTFGYRGDGGPARAGWLNDPQEVAVDGHGNLIFADQDNNRIRVIAAAAGTFYGQAMTEGDIYTVAGDGTSGYSGDGGAATGAGLSLPTGVTIDHHGNLVIADREANRIRVVAAATGTFYGQAMTAGDIYTVAGNGQTRQSWNDGPAIHAGLGQVSGIAVDLSGNLVIGSITGYRVRVVAAKSGTFYHQAMAAGDIYPVAGNAKFLHSGSGGTPGNAELSGPTSVAVASQVGYAVLNTAQASLVAAASGTFFGRPMDAGRIFTIAGTSRPGFSGDGAPAFRAQLGSGPGSVAFDHARNLLIADSANNVIRVVAAAPGRFYGRAMTAGDIYTVAGDRRFGYRGDGGLATAAEMASPQGVSVDRSGNLVIADSGNNVIRVVAAAPGRFYGRAMTAGDIYTVAGNGRFGYTGDGGLAAAAEMASPQGLSVDGSGNLVIGDVDNDVIRVVAATSGNFYGQAMKAGDIYTVAGNGTFGDTGDGGPATAAEMGGPRDASVDGDGNLLIADVDNNRVRVVAASNGNFYGQAMTAGDIYTVAGDGQIGFSGDGGPAISGSLFFPDAVAADGAGRFLIADNFNNRVRLVSPSP